MSGEVAPVGFLALAVCLAVCLNVAASEEPSVRDPSGARDRQVARAADAARMRSLAAQLSAVGSRMPGYAGHARAASAILAALHSAGIDRVGTQRFEVVVPVERAARLTALGDAAAGAEPLGTVTLHGLWPNLVVSPATPPEGITGPLIYAGTGELTAYDGKDIAGAIVVLEFDCGMRWIDAAALGARAVVFIEPALASRGEAEKKFLSSPLNLPRYWAPRADGKRLRQWARQGVRATLKGFMALRAVEAENIYAVIPAAAPLPSDTDPAEREIVVVGAYYDAVSVVPALAPGADGTGSVAALLELARYLHAHPPRRRVLLIVSDAHYEALAGMRAFYHLMNTAQDAYEARTASVRVRREIRRRILKPLLEQWARDPEKEGPAQFTQRDLLAKLQTSVWENGIRLDRTEREFLKRPGSALRRYLRAWFEQRIGRLDDRLRYARLEAERSDEARREVATLEAKAALLRRVKSKVIGSARHRERQKAAGGREALARINRAFQEGLAQVQVEVDAQLADLERRLARRRHNQALRDVLNPYAGGRGFFLGFDLSSRGTRVGLFYKGWLYDERDKAVRMQYGDLADRYQRWARAVAASLDVDLDAHWQVTLKSVGGREWYTFLPGRPAFDGEVFGTSGTKHARIKFNGVTFSTVGDGRPLVDTPHDTFDRVAWPNLVRQVRFALPLAVRIIEDAKMPRMSFGAERHQRFVVLNGRAVKKGSARAVFADVPVGGAVIVTRYHGNPTLDTKTYLGVRNDMMAMSNPFGEFQVPGIRYMGQQRVEAYKTDPATGRITHAVDKGTLNIAPNDSLRVGVNESFETVRPLLFACRPLEVVGLIDPRYLTQLRNARIIDAVRESVPVRFGTAAAALGEPISILFGEPDARLKITYSAGQLGVRMALLNIDPARAAREQADRSDRTGTGFDLRRTDRILFPSYQAARDLYWLDHRRIERLRAHGIHNRRLANPADWKPLADLGDAGYLERVSAAHAIVHLRAGACYGLIEARRQVDTARLIEVAGELARGISQSADASPESLLAALDGRLSGRWRAAAAPRPLNDPASFQALFGPLEPFRERGWRSSATLALRSGTGQTLRVSLHAFDSPDAAADLMRYQKLVRGSGLHDRTALSLYLADRERARRCYSRFVEHARAAWATESRAYPDVRGTADDTILGVIFYMFLVLPFSFFLERLLFGFPRIEKQILAFFLIFVGMFALLRMVHPAFELTATPTMVLLAFIILALSLIVISIIYGKFNREIQALQQEVQGGQAADINRLSATAVAVALGIGNMRRRRVRTLLTCVTIILLTFTALSFTSVVHSVRSTRIARDTPALYEGFLIREVNWQALEESVYHILRNQYGREHTVCPRAWYLSEDPKKPSYMEVSMPADPTRRVTATALLGLTAREAQLLRLDRRLVAGRWLTGDDTFACLLSERFVADLQLDTAAVSAGTATVRMAGRTFRVVGVVDTKAFDRIQDLDGEALTPVDYKAAQDAGAGQPAEDAVLELLGEGTGLRYEHLLSKDVVVVPYRTLMNMNGRLRSVAVRFGGEGGAGGAGGAPLTTAEKERLIESLLIRLAKNVYAGVDGKTYLHASTEALHFAGLANLIIPITIAGFIVLNTMLGSVYERNYEISIYSALGLAPSHVAALFLSESVVYATLGAISGYLLGQSTAWVLTHVGPLAALFAGLTLNYSSVSTVFVTIIVMGSVVLSTIYPAMMAARLASPAASRRWEVPRPQDDQITLELPFTFATDQALGVCAFLFDFFADHSESTVGRFYVKEINFRPVASERGEGYLFYFMCWLTPFDLGVSQEVQLYLVPTADGVLVVELCLFRVSGHESAWRRINRPFLDVLRKQLLLWRTLGTGQRQRCHAAGQALLAHVRGGGKAHELLDPSSRPAAAAGPHPGES